MTTFTDVFNAGTINPAWVGYKLYNITTNTTLSWPVLTTLSANIVAGFMQCQTTAGLSFTMPDATDTSTGTTCIFDNTGSNQFTVLDNGGNTILTVATATAWVLVLTDNSTANGTWISFQLGAGSSSAIAAALAGYGIKAITTTLNQEYPAFSYSTNQTIISSHRASTIIWTGGAGTFSMTTAATLGTGFFFNVANQGNGALTVVDAGGANVNGSAAGQILNPGDSAIFCTNGSLWVTIGFGQDAEFAFSYIVINAAGSGTYTLSGAELNQIAYKFTGVLTGNMDVIVPSTVQQYWVDNSTTGSFVFGIRTSTQASPGVSISNGSTRAIMYCNGTDVVLADTQGLSTPITVAQGGTGATTAAGARTNLNVPSTLDAFTYVQIFG